MPQSEFWPFTRNKRVNDTTVEYGGQSILQKQLGDIEGEVNEMKMELAAMKRTHHDLKTDQLVEMVSEDVATYDAYRSHDRYKEDNEIVKLRADLMHAKSAAEEERFKRLKYEAKLKDLEVKLNEICGEGKPSELKEARKITEEEVVGLKTHIRDLKEQIEEMKITDEEKTEQVQEYRVKYLQAQQQVEELKRQVDVMEFENKQASDQIQLELHKMKIQFQEKLLELAPLPDLLKSAQIQLQEANEMQKLAEDNTAQISNELHRVKEKLVLAVNSLNQEKVEKSRCIEENISYKSELEEKQRELDELLKELDDSKCRVVRLEEKLIQLEARYNEKAAEYIQLSKDLDELKEESSRSLTRAKERADSAKHYLQTQISGLERQMMTCRAQCKMYQRERDQIRQRMQIQVQSLKENFDMVESRMRHLQGQVSLLKQCYSISLPDDVEVTQPEQEPFSYVQMP